MKALKVVTFILLLLGIFGYSETSAQHKHGRGHYKQEKRYHKKLKKYDKKKIVYYNTPRSYRHYGQPRWAKAHRYQSRHHVYFRDYCTFYDPHRRGYIYWSRNQWIFSRSVPAFLAHVDLGRARIQVMTEVPIDRHPEYYYREYARSYPRGTHVSINFQLPPI